jgi:hypothetical protein
MVNFANLQTATEFAKMVPLEQLSEDLAAGRVPNFSYIVPDECDDMHGAPPWCVDSNASGTVQQNWLIARGDKFVGNLVNQVTSSSTWPAGNNVIVVTFDEGNAPKSQIYTAVITNHGPRGLTDKTSYNHYSLLASLQQTFGVGCLLNSCTAPPMAKLFAITGSTDIPTLPPPFNFPTSADQISKQGDGSPAAAVSLSGSGWQVVPTHNFGAGDNILAGVLQPRTLTPGLWAPTIHLTRAPSQPWLNTLMERAGLLSHCRTWGYRKTFFSASPCLLRGKRGQRDIS